MTGGVETGASEELAAFHAGLVPLQWWKDKRKVGTWAAICCIVGLLVVLGFATRSSQSTGGGTQNLAIVNANPTHHTKGDGGKLPFTTSPTTAPTTPVTVGSTGTYGSGYSYYNYSPPASLPFTDATVSSADTATTSPSTTEAPSTGLAESVTTTSTPTTLISTGAPASGTATTTTTSPASTTTVPVGGGTTPLPDGAVGILGVGLVFGMMLVYLQRRRTRRTA